MDQADGLVEVPFDEGKTGVFAAQGDIEGFLEWLVRIQHDNLIARGHDVAHPEFIQFERIDQDLALGIGNFFEFSGMGHQDREFFSGVDVLALAKGINVEKGFQEPVCRALEETDDPVKGFVEEMQRSDEQHRCPEGAADCDGLRQKLTDHHVQECERRICNY